jgi:DNA-binding winged helix-turn-helix (wHTH) protein/Tol biopolymer transport system component
MTDSVNSENEYRFGSFTYRASDNTLRCGGETLPLTPKALELLRIFLANPGTLLGKAELMNKLWPDTYVEESNLAVTVRRLRKALADDAQNPRCVATVARQGYRFIAEVNQETPHDVNQNRGRRDRPLRYLVPLAVAGALLIASISLGSRYFNRNSPAAPILATPFAVEKFSTSGKVRSAAISPDGEKIVYSIHGGAGDAVWLREVASGNNVEIIPASGELYYRFAFAPDGATLYFTRGPRMTGDPADLYRVSVFGGVPTKIVNDTRGWISVAPDGGSISFVRCKYRVEEYCSLWTADSTDGKNERMLASRPLPIRIGDNAISPDGKSIVFAVGQSENASNDFGLSSIDLESGIERELSNEKFFNVGSLQILPDNSGALVTASRGSTQRLQIWKIDFVDGVARPRTKDSLSYDSISLDKTGSRMVATQVSNNFHLVRSTMDQLDRKEILAEPAWIFAFDSDNGIVYQSDSTGDMEIWRMDDDGTSHRQLTNSPGDDVLPVVSPENDEVFFCSNRTGRMEVWRMKVDGSDQSQMTKVEGGFPLFADREWVYYQHGIDRSLWRVSVRNEAEELVFEKAPADGPFVFAPSGRQTAFVDTRGERASVVVISIPDGKELKSFPLADGKGRVELAWLPDESAFGYTISNTEGASAFWMQPMDGSPPYQSGEIEGDPIIFLSFGSNTNSVAFVQGFFRHDVVMLSGLQ